MAYDWLNHKTLRIVKGIGKLPTDTNSAENDPVVFNLLSEPVALTMDGWSPQIAALKSGGVWADSPISDGRSLIAAPVGNVTEKMTFIIADSTFLGVQRHLLALNDMALDCRAFWEGQAQIDPVYLAWWAGCGKGEQYALLYNMDVTTEYLSADKPTIRVNLTLEREPYWRGLPPGANPKLWTFYVNSQQIGTNKTLSDADLKSGTDHLVYDASVKNRHEFDPTTYLSVLSRNYVDIPSNFIPGDAPALVEMSLSIDVTTTTVAARGVYVWRSTKPATLKDRNGSLYGQTAILNAGDGSVTTLSKTIDATNGVYSNGSSANRYIVNGTVGASSTITSALRWPVMPTYPILASMLERGRFAVFVRCKQTSGAAGDVQVRFNAGLTLLNFFETSDYTNMPTFTSAYPFGLLYLGTLTVPPNADALASNDGRGLQVPDKSGSNSDLVISLDVKNNNAAGRTVQFCDLILMSLDEPCINMKQPIFSSGSGIAAYTYDNTGYFGHGDTIPFSRTSILRTSLTLHPLN